MKKILMFLLILFVSVASKNVYAGCVPSAYLYKGEITEVYSKSTCEIESCELAPLDLKFNFLDENSEYYKLRNITEKGLSSSEIQFKVESNICYATSHATSGVFGYEVKCKGKKQPIKFFGIAGTVDEIELADVAIASRSLFIECGFEESGYTDVEVNTDGNNCSVLGILKEDIQSIFKIFKIIAPILVVVMSVYDFIKAVTGKVENEMKKVFMRLMKRLAFAVILFFLPNLIDFVLGLVDPGYNTCINV